MLHVILLVSGAFWSLCAVSMITFYLVDERAHRRGQPHTESTVEPLAAAAPPRRTASLEVRRAS